MSFDVTPVAATSLVTVEEAVAEITSAGYTTEADTAQVANLIAQAEDAVRSYCRRAFTPGTVTESRVIPMFGDSCVYPDELVSLTSIADRDGNLLTDYIVTPGTPHVRWVDIPHREHAYLTLTGVWGWSKFPPAVKRAVLVTVRIWFLVDMATATLDGTSGGYPRILSLPRDVLPLLDPHRML